MEFKEFQLGDLVKYNNEKISVFEAKKESYISTENMLADKKGIGDIAKLPEKGKVNIYSEEDILISNIRPYFKKIWFSNSIGSHSSDVLNLRVTNEKVLPKYVYYYIFQDRFFEYMTMSSKGTKMPRGDKQAIMKYPVFIPDISVQSKIVSTLSNLDDKIQNNLEIIDNLEQISQTLFKRWFIDFEFPNEDGKPYKSSGGEMVESELGEIPKGWEVNSVNNIFKITIGKTPSRKDSSMFSDNEGTKWVSISDMKSNGAFITKTKEYLVDEAFIKYNVKTVPKDTVLLSFKLTIGRVKITSENMSTNEAIAHFKQTEKSPSKEYIYCYLNNFNYDSLGNTSSIAQAINSKIVKDMRILLPNDDIMNDFVKCVRPNFNLIRLLQSENENLENLRDTLLPKLLSGEIEIPEDLEV